MVALPTVVTVPSQISRSWELLSVNPTSLVQVAAPPPLTEDTLAVAEETFTVTTSASPTVFGLTGNDPAPVPTTSARPPTAVTAVDAEATPPDTANDATISSAPRPAAVSHRDTRQERDRTPVIAAAG